VLVLLAMIWARSFFAPARGVFKGPAGVVGAYFASLVILAFLIAVCS
jgi:hypothetical protein